MKEYCFPISDLQSVISIYSAFFSVDSTQACASGDDFFFFLFFLVTGLLWIVV